MSTSSPIPGISRQSFPGKDARSLPGRSSSMSTGKRGRSMNWSCNNYSFSETAAKEEVVTSLRFLATEGARRGVLQPMAAPSIRGPQPFVQCQPNHELNFEGSPCFPERLEKMKWTSKKSTQNFSIDWYYNCTSRIKRKQHQQKNGTRLLTWPCYIVTIIFFISCKNTEYVAPVTLGRILSGEISGCWDKWCY